MADDGRWLKCLHAQTAPYPSGSQWSARDGCVSLRGGIVGQAVLNIYGRPASQDHCYFFLQKVAWLLWLQPYTGTRCLHWRHDEEKLEDVGSTLMNWTPGLAECKTMNYHGISWSLAVQLDAQTCFGQIAFSGPWCSKRHRPFWSNGHGRRWEAEFQESCLEKESTLTKGTQGIHHDSTHSPDIRQIALTNALTWLKASDSQAHPHVDAVGLHMSCKRNCYIDAR